MPNQITDAVITKVYADASGTSKFEPFDPYTIYNFYVQGQDKKFSWFATPKKVTPVEGMQIAYLEYTTTVEGEYTNHKVSKLTVKEGIAQPTNPTPPNGATTNCPNSVTVAVLLDCLSLMTHGVGIIHPLTLIQPSQAQQPVTI